MYVCVPDGRQGEESHTGACLMAVVWCLLDANQKLVEQAHNFIIITYLL